MSLGRAFHWWRFILSGCFLFGCWIIVGWLVGCACLAFMHVHCLLSSCSYVMCDVASFRDNRVFLSLYRSVFSVVL